eukprot:gene353-7852_t
MDASEQTVPLMHDIESVPINGESEVRIDAVTIHPSSQFSQINENVEVEVTNDSPHKGLSTFFGVFVPCVLSIFSVILFLRLGFVVGQAGVIGSLVMLTVAYFVVALTILSISAISTNGLIKGGGAYYMISRSLGPEFGGSIGTIFFLANICASALYVAGFVESLVDNFGPSSSFNAFPGGQWMVFAYSSAVLLLCLIICIVGANAFAKASFLIFIVVITSVIMVFVSFPVVGEREVDPPSTNSYVNGTLLYTGIKEKTLKSNINAEFSIDYTTGIKQTFQSVFGVLFNGCTGIMAGANMSGDLEQPSRSIPLGTLAASAFTYFVYVALFLLSAASSSRTDINIKAPLVTMGVFAATLSAALSTLIGASRILEALSRDKLFGSWMTVFVPSRSLSKNPVRAVLASWLLVQLVLFVGKINIIAPIVSMLFLLCYGVVNLACFVQRVQASPNFRPTFRYFSWHTALVGAAACVAVMFFVEPMYAAAAFLLMIILFIYIHYHSIPSDWGDVSQALIYHQVRKYLLRLKDSTISVKYWRPQILFLVTNPRKQHYDIGFMNDLKKGGLFVLGEVLVQPFSRSAIEEARVIKTAWLGLAAVERWKAFVDVIVSSSTRDGVRSLLASAGLGGMRPNIVVLNYPRDSVEVDQLSQYSTYKTDKVTTGLLSRSTSACDLQVYNMINEAFPKLSETTNHQLEKEFVGIIRDSLLMAKSVIVTRNFAKLHDRLKQAQGTNIQYYIDLYPIVRPGSSRSLSFDFIIQMATILHMVKRWRKLRIRVFSIVDNGKEASSEETRLREILEDVRLMDAEIKMISYIAENASTAHSTAFLEASMQEQFAFVNHMILANSTKTCIVFSYLPSPPERPADAYETGYDSSNESSHACHGSSNHPYFHKHNPTQERESHSLANRNSEYLENIDNTPPICLFHGIEPVVTTNAQAV